MASIAANAHPDASDWPDEAWIDGYDEIAANLLPSSSLLFAPLVEPDALEGFGFRAVARFSGTTIHTTTTNNNNNNISVELVVVPVAPIFGHDDDNNNNSSSNNADDAGATGNGIDGALLPLLQQRVPDDDEDSYNHRNGGGGSGNSNSNPFFLFPLLTNIRAIDGAGSLIDSAVNCATAGGLGNSRRSDGDDCRRSGVVVFGEGDEGEPSGIVVTPVFPADDPGVLAGFVLAVTPFGAVVREMVSE